MLQIEPVSELRNYNKVLKKVKKDDPVFLTKNGYGKYALIDIEKYDEFNLAMKIADDLKQAEKSKHYTLTEIENKLLR